MKSLLLKDVKEYSAGKLRADLIAGLTVAVILIPQGMAYSLLAGLHPVYGLYTALVPMVIYPLFSSSKYLSVGPVALMSIIVLSGVSLFAEPGTKEYLDMVLMVSFMSGVIQILFSVFKLGILSNFLSQPVMKGFISAAGVIILLSQIKYLFSLDYGRVKSVPEMILAIGKNLSTGNFFSLAIGLGSLALILGLKRIHKNIPGSIIVVILGSWVLYNYQLTDKNVPIVGNLPQGLPSISIDFFHWDYLVTLFPTAFVISVICFIGSFSLAKTLSLQEDDPPVKANLELLGLGIAKIISSFFNAFPSTGSFSRTAINHQAGARTGLASIIGAIFIGLTLMFVSHWFYYLPEPVLAAIVIASVFSLINYRDALSLFHLDRRDFWIFISTFVFTLFLGIQNGVFAGIILSLLLVIFKLSKPHYAVLGKIPDSDIYRNVDRFEEAKTWPEILILRYDDDILFANAEHFLSCVLEELTKKPATKHIVIDMSSVSNMDSTGVDYMKQLQKKAKELNVALHLTGPKGPLRDILLKNMVYDVVGDNFIYSNIDKAVQSILYEEQTKISMIK